MHKLKIINLDSVSSTNDYARRLAEEGRPEVTVVRAGRQTRGRGRFGRFWHSPEGRGLYLSFLLRPADTKNITFLNLVAALAVLKALPELPELKVKWPNDLMLGDKKTGGILLESGSRGNVPDYVILGLGLNVNCGKNELPDTATSLFAFSGKEYPLDRLFDTIVNEFCVLYEDYKRGETEDMTARITERSATLGKTVRALVKGCWLEGTASSFDGQGRLTIRLNSGEEKTVFPSEVEHLR